MIRWFVLVLFLSVFLVSGCGLFSREEVPKPEENVPSILPMPVVPITLLESVEPTRVVGQENETWIYPSKVQIGNFFPGARGEFTLRVHNGDLDSNEFSVYYRVPDAIRGEYAQAIEGVRDWVVIEDSNFTLEPKETKEVLVILEMPRNTEVFAPNWEFWVAVKEKQTGMVQVELASRVLVEMK